MSKYAYLEKIDSRRKQLGMYVQAAIATLSTDPDWTVEDSLFLFDSVFTHVSDADLAEDDADSTLLERARTLVEDYLIAIDEDSDGEAQYPTEPDNVFPIGKPSPRS